MMETLIRILVEGPPTPGVLPVPDHWGVTAGLVAIALFLVRAVYKDLKRPDRVPPDAGPDPRLPLFRDTIVTLWATALITGVGWVVAGGDLSGVGFGLRPGTGTWVALVLVSLFAALLLLQWRGVVTSEEARERYRDHVENAKGFDWLRPTSPREYASFRIVAVTAGITEEVIFRGFLIGVLSLWIPVWAAASAAVVAFVGGHAYQGFTGMLRILPVTVILTAIYLLSGSILPGIALHVAVDLVGGAVMWAVRRDPSTSQAAGGSESAHAEAGAAGG